MRDIKFRAWEKETEDMVYWKRLTMKPRVLVQIFDGDEGFELMQFTNLYDKNGEEIYEGDIVKYYAKPRKRAVFQKIVKWINEIGYIGWNVTGKNTEVIGNIYENPELLNSKSLKE